MPIQPRSEIENIPEIPHGGFHANAAADILDFSSNVNPFGPSPRIWDAMRRVPIGQHPDPRAEPLRQFLARSHHLSPRQILVGNGSVELIYHLAVVFLRAGDRAFIVEPTFGEYRHACSIMGAEIVRWRLDAADNFALDADALIRAARQINPRLFFLCNPNNPTGVYIERDVIEKILRDCPDLLLVLDEAFVRFVSDAWDARELLRHENLILLRSLTKDYALTGLRVGYAIGNEHMITALEKVQPPWSVNALAQAASLAALEDEAHLRHSLSEIARAKTQWMDDLTRLKMTPLPSRTNFFLLPVVSATEFAAQLLARKIRVRDCASFGLPAHVRIATRRVDEITRAK